MEQKHLDTSGNFANVARDNFILCEHSHSVFPIHSNYSCFLLSLYLEGGTYSIVRRKAIWLHSVSHSITVNQSLTFWHLSEPSLSIVHAHTQTYSHSFLVAFSYEVNVAAQVYVEGKI